MLNSLLNGKISQQVISDIKALVYKTQRNYIDPCKHYEPHDISWQWMPREGPEEKCKHRCVSRKCPKKRFFPRFKKQYVPKDMCAEKKKDDRMTWKEYFSYLLPDHMQAEFIKKRPKLVQCRHLAATRRMKCADAYDMECCRDGTKRFKEWHDQGVIHVLDTGEARYQQQDGGITGCTAIERTIPRCVLPRHGDCVMKTYEKDLSLPYQGPEAAPPPPPQLRYTFRKKKCFPDIPRGRDKAMKLSCDKYLEFKTVSCPVLYRRHEPEEPEKPCDGDPTPCPPPLPPCPSKCPPCPRPYTTTAFQISTRSFSDCQEPASLCEIKKKKGQKPGPTAGSSYKERCNNEAACGKCMPPDCMSCSAPAKRKDCKMRKCKCPPSKNPRPPGEKISNPYWDNKAPPPYGRCNQPRDEPDD